MADMHDGWSDCTEHTKHGDWTRPVSDDTMRYRISDSLGWTIKYPTTLEACEAYLNEWGYVEVTEFDNGNYGTGYRRSFRAIVPYDDPLLNYVTINDR